MICINGLELRNFGLSYVSNSSNVKYEGVLYYLNKKLCNWHREENKEDVFENVDNSIVFVIINKICLQISNGLFSYDLYSLMTDFIKFGLIEKNYYNKRQRVKYTPYAKDKYLHICTVLGSSYYSGEYMDKKEFCTLSEITNFKESKLNDLQMNSNIENHCQIYYMCIGALKNNINLSINMGN